MFDELLRALKDRLLAPVARRLGRRVSPTAVTAVGLGVGLAAALLAARGAYRWALAAWLANRVLDGLDGAIARVTGRQGELGGYLDIVADFLVYAALPIGLVVARPTVPLALAALALLASYYVNAASWMYLAALLERRGAGAAARGERTSVTMPPGLIAGTETIAFYALCLLAAPRGLVPLFGGFAALVLLTAAQRVAWAWRTLRREG